MKLKTKARDENGAVLVIVAISMLILLTLSAGGIMMFTLYGANREMQKAADQAALAGAAALPLLRPGQVLDSLPLNPVYSLTENLGLDAPLKGLSNVPDPRAVACAYGTRSLVGNSSTLVNTFGAAPNPPLTGYCNAAPWSSQRVAPVLNGLSTPLTTCLNSLSARVESLRVQAQGIVGGLPLVGLVLSTLGLGSITEAVAKALAPLEKVVNSVKDLEALSPALLTPEMTVTVRSGVKAPLLSFITGSDGVQMTVAATAERRLKNAIVLPSTPALTGVDLNNALAQTRQPIMNALGTLNSQLNTILGAAPGGLGLSGCQNLLDPSSKIVRDIGDIYNPPTAPASGPRARDLIEGSSAAALRAASEAGTSIDNVAGEAFVIIRQGPNPQTLGTLVSGLLGPLGLSGLLGTLQIPAMDVAVVAAHNLEDGNLNGDCDPTTPTPPGDFICDLAAARGLFTATLVK